MDTLTVVVLAGALVVGLVAVGGWVGWGRRRHAALVDLERTSGNLALRRRMRGDATGGRRRVAETVVRAEYARPGWVWIKVEPRPQAHRGEDRRALYRERVVWALTKRAAHRKAAAGERGAVSDLFVLVVVVVLAGAALTRLGQDATPGDVVDWLWMQGSDLITAALRWLLGVLEQ